MKRRSNCNVMIIVNAATNLANFRDEIIQELIRENYHVLLVSPPGKRLDVYRENASCTVLEVNVNRHGKNIFEELILFKNYIKLLRKFRPICLLTYTIKPNIYGGLASRLLRIPYLVNITGLGTVFDKKNIIQKVVIIAYKRVMKHATNVFFQNEENRSAFIRLGIDFPCSEILPGSGVNLEINKIEKYPGISEPIRFLFVARILKEKGIEELVAAAKIIKKEYTTVEFHVIGTCEYDYEERIDRWNNEGAIIYHGAKPNIHPYMQMCSALIHPSYYMEGMSNVCLEAAATGRPVLTTNWLGCKETIDDGITGLIFEPQNVNSLVDVIRRFIELPYDEKVEMGLNGRKKMEKQFDRKFVVNSYLKEINRLSEY